MTHMTIPTAPLEALELATPVGTLAVLVTPEDGVVRAAGFTPVAEQQGRLPAVLAARGARPGSADGPAAAVVAAVAAYSDGETGALDAVPVAQPGGAFLQRAWLALREVPPGTTVSYATLAARAGSAAAVRAAGSACSRNLVAPFVPCHRVVHSDGTLGGYYYGRSMKARLLAHERGEDPAPPTRGG